MIVKELLERTPTYLDSIGRPYVEGRVVALSSKTGRQVFDTKQNKEKHIERYYTWEVVKIWASHKERSDMGFSGVWYQPVTMLYIREK